MHWLLVVVGCAAAGYAGWSAWTGWRARRWPVAPGRIVALAFPEKRRRGQPVPTFEVHYMYAVGDQTFEGRRIGFGVDHVVPPPGLRLSDPVRVYYDPRDPTHRAPPGRAENRSCP